MSYTAERRLEEKEQRRNDIIDAAEVVFAREGLEAATLGLVARQARLSRGLIYFYFKDKDDLIHGVVHRGLRLLRDRFGALVEKHETGLEKLMAIGRDYFAFSRENPVYFSVLMHWETQDYGFEDLTENKTNCMLESNRVFDIMIKAIHQGIADGSIRRDIGDPMQVVVSLWAFTHGLVQVANHKEKMLTRFHRVNLKNLVDHAFEVMVHGLCP